MDGLEVKVLSTSAFKQIKRALGASGRNRVLREIGYTLKRITQENFGPSGPYRPEEWPPYAHDYPQYGKYEDEPATLIRTGKLVRSIYVHVTDDYAEVGSDVEYADTHQFGGENMPPRPFLPIRGTRGGLELTPQAQQEIEAAAYRVFMDEMTK